MRRIRSSLLQHQRGQATLSVVLIYGIFAALWIQFSDKAVEALFADPAMIIRASMAKGWLFVAVTTGLLYVLVKRQIALLNDAHKKEIESYQERQKSLDLLNAIVDNSEDAIFAKDTKGRILLFNQAACRYAGKTAAEIIGRDDREIFPPAQAEQLMAFDRQIMKDGATRSTEEILDTAIGNRILLATKGPLRDADQRITGIFGISRDITDRKRAEESLRQSEDKLRSIIRVAPIGIGVVADRRFTEVNETLEKITGYSKAELLGQSSRMLYPSHEEFEFVGREKYRQIREHGTGSVETRFKRKTGEIIDVLLSSTPVDPADLSRGVTFTAMDITARNRSVKELRESEERFRALVEQSAAGIYIVQDNCFRYVNPYFARLAGYDSPQELMDQVSFIDLIAPEQRPMIAEKMKRRMMGDASDNHYHLTGIRRDGSRIEVELHGNIIQLNGRPALIGLFIDTTPRFAAEQELRARNEELERFNQAMIGRELDMVELKQRINELSRELGREPLFDLAFLDPTRDKDKASHGS